MLHLDLTAIHLAMNDRRVADAAKRRPLAEHRSSFHGARRAEVLARVHPEVRARAIQAFRSLAKGATEAAEHPRTHLPDLRRGSWEMGQKMENP